MNHKLLNCFCLLLFFVVACGEKQNGIKEYVKNADSVSIAFYHGVDSSIQVTITERASIEKLTSYIDGRSVEPGKCKEDGSIWYYQGAKKKMQVDFCLKEDCAMFSYMMNDRMFTKTMSSEANKYLSGIKSIASSSL